MYICQWIVHYNNYQHLNIMWPCTVPSLLYCTQDPIGCSSIIYIAMVSIKFVFGYYMSAVFMLWGSIYSAQVDLVVEACTPQRVLLVQSSYRSVWSWRLHFELRSVIKNGKAMNTVESPLHILHSICSKPFVPPPWFPWHSFDQQAHKKT